MADTKKAVSAAEKVTIKLPLNRDKQDDVFVSVNGMTYLIQRGKEVEVPVYVKEVLDHAEDMEMEALEKQRKLQSK